MTLHIVQGTVQDTCQQEARYWLTQLYCAEPNQQEMQAFSNWINASSENTQAFQKLEKVWFDIEELNEVDAMVQSIVAKDTAEIKNSATLKFPKTIMRGMVAVLTMLMIATVLVFGLSPQQDKIELIVYQSELAQNRDLLLNDGSKVVLAGNSKISTSFSQEYRQVTLHHGQAYFDVAKDTERPFIVTAKSTQVSVKGTAFDVRLGVNNTRVSVARGLVDVEDSLGRADSQIQSLTANEQVLVGEDGKFSGHKTEFKGQSRFAWLRGRFEFDDASLQEVVADINRYYKKTIVIVDPKINTLKITTSFKVSQIDAVLSGLAAAYPIQLKTSSHKVEIIADPSRSK